MEELNPNIEVSVHGQEMMAESLALGKSDLIVSGISPDAIRDGDTVTVVTYEIDEHWWLADERARDLALPASMHQAATAQAAREIAEDEGTFVAIRSSH